MKNLQLIAALLLFSLFSDNFYSQDTTVVRTLEFSDITKRRGWYIFPEVTNEYQRILMYYTLKCDPATTQDNFACGEWDYTTFTNLYQYENVGSPQYIVNGTQPDIIQYLSSPTYTYYLHTQEYIVYDEVLSEQDYSIGAGTETTFETINTINENGRSQYIWTAAELTTAGLSPGNIDKLKFELTGTSDEMDFLTLRMKHTNLTELNENQFEQEDLQTVYSLNTDVFDLGANTINFSNPFEWDGTSNVIVDFSFSNNVEGFTNHFTAEDYGSNVGVASTGNDGYLDFEWGNYVQVTSEAFETINNEITISCWMYGDPDDQPQNGYLFEGLDFDNNRVVNVHAPWSNSRVYWDCGNSLTNSYDRIDKEATFDDFAGQWNHWAFTKNASTGDMKIYLNGNLWHSGTGMNRTMAGIVTFRIAGRAGPNQYGAYDGAINNFEIWNTELNQTDIQNWMFKDIDASHPEYTSLMAYYKFDEENGSIAMDSSPNENNAELLGMPARRDVKGKDLYRNMSATSVRPNVIFTQGNYTSHLETIDVIEAVENAQISILENSTYRDINLSGIQTELEGITYGWAAGWMYTYNISGEVVDSVLVPHTDELVNEFSSQTVQIQNYVTPYGIGLSLGANGFRWVYDVTDMSTLLRDTIELSAGNQQELIDLKFVMIEGTPPRDIIDFEQIWLGDYQHADIANDVVMQAVDLELDPTASQYRVKTRTTGHWFGGFQNCAEFCPKIHHVKVNGSQEFEWMNFTDCGDNPVIDQGGTWIYDRAGWCPGAFGDTYDHDLTPFVNPGETVSIDYGMEVTANGMEGNYRTSVQLVSYGDINYDLDARVEEILAPNDWEYRSKINPVCANPSIVIKNTGATTLTSLTISYNVVGGSVETYEWSGALEFLETEEVLLPLSSESFWNTDSESNVFEVSVSAPNGGVDEYALNNQLHTSFEKPPVYTNNLNMRYLTNNVASENSYTVKDLSGNVLYSMTGSNLDNNTIYNDTLELDNGCYVLEWLDSGEDGLAFFANNDGTGYFRFYDAVTGSFLKGFEPNYGRFFVHYFTIDKSVGIDELTNTAKIDVYPNPTDDIVNIKITGITDKSVNVEILNYMGSLVYSSKEIVKNGVLQSVVDVSRFSDGLYTIRVKTENGVVVEQVVKQ